MKNRKYWVLGATMTLVTISSPAVAATLANGEGQSCGSAVGVFHFVNNQTDQTATAGTLTATFSGGRTVIVTASKINRNVQHFHVTSMGTLLNATTNLPGRLVLSDYTCEGVKKS